MPVPQAATPLPAAVAERGLQQQHTEMLQEVRQLRHEVRLLSQRVEHAESLDGSRTLLQHAQSEQPTPDLPRLPAGTIQELEAAEAPVHNEAVSATLHKHLLHIGGKCLREIGANAKAVMAHEVQVLFSLRGRKGKRAFVDLTLQGDFICQKVGVDLVEAKVFIKRWIPGSGDRSGGRKRRFKEAFVVEQPNDPCSRSGDHRLPATAGFLPSHCNQGLGSTTIATLPPTRPRQQQDNAFVGRPPALA
ncbi:hypothetical protein HPB52_023702 [Rhipicephalus sanguineus]|uniref:Uncharacterized protein n=1 Tax=Rhipicephalus sanguineus TaxID=34632 RepID=A0A9D4TC38_RHISA|nr:hypothetical protein HPB52_023702 [Rhipicephalus sanguineus]